jgi:hypothetical protein
MTNLKLCTQVHVHVHVQVECCECIHLYMPLTAWNGSTSQPADAVLLMKYSVHVIMSTWQKLICAKAIFLGFI